jgi:hypothetical protein
VKQLPERWATESGYGDKLLQAVSAELARMDSEYLPKLKQVIAHANAVADGKLPDEATA